MTLNDSNPARDLAVAHAVQKFPVS
eukprot:COSAG02_NODE_64150_length_261_cov_0.648148_1_plen_24_part_10